MTSAEKVPFPVDSCSAGRLFLEKKWFFLARPSGVWVKQEINPFSLSPKVALFTQRSNLMNFRTPISPASRFVVLVGSVILLWHPSLLPAQEVKPLAVQTKTESFLSGGKSIPVERFEMVSQEPRPVIILVHGLDGLEKTGPIYRLVAHQLAGKGYVVFLVHYFERTGTDGQQAQSLLATFCKYLNNQPLVSQKQEEVLDLFHHWEETIEDAVDYTRAQANVKKDQIILAGFSMGAFLSLAVAADEDMGIAAVVACCGGLPPGLKVQTLPPLLILHGQEDRIVPVEKAWELEQACKACQTQPQIKVYAKTGHLFFNDKGAFDFGVAQDAQILVQQFLEKHLRPGMSGQIAKRGM
jgi:carboxymethylenebutenolidase